MDMILSRRIVPTWNEDLTEADPDSGVMVQEYGDGGDLEDDVDLSVLQTSNIGCPSPQCWGPLPCT
jgi:hypothetical protein